MPPARATVLSNGERNKLATEDRPAHDWYRFVLSFPPHLVRDYLDKFAIGPGSQVLDPFCGTGTTLVECKKRGIASIGLEANPMAHFASEVKLNWSPDPDKLVRHAAKVARIAQAALEADGITDVNDDNNGLPLFGPTRRTSSQRAELRRLPPEQASLLLTDSISPLPLHKVLVLLDSLEAARDARFARHERLALAHALVFSISNLHFGPEVGVGPAKRDSAVVRPWLDRVQAMALDLRALQGLNQTSALVYHGDARNVSTFVPPGSIDAVITSPPYPNEKDYTRTTRLESVLLGFVRTKEEIRQMKKSFVRSNTRSVYTDDTDHEWVVDNRRVQAVAKAIEARRIALGKTSGFERLYHRVATLYFGGMARHLADLRKALKPGAWLAYVVGDQASYLQVMIHTGQVIAELAQALGYELIRIDLFRKRRATATRSELREEVVVLRWPGPCSQSRQR